MPDTSRAVARYDGPRTIDELVRYSQVMADGTSVLPAQYRNKPGSILFAVEYAKALDVSPVTAITGIHVIDGKPTASAGLISALIRRAGHTLRVKLEGTYEAGDLKATATLIRSDDPNEPYSSVWTLERAARARLVVRNTDGRYVAVKSGSAWDTYPESMLKARAITEVGRDAAEDVLLGVHYTAEELGAEVDAAGDVVYTVTQVPESTPQAAQEPAQEPASTTTAPAAGDDQRGPEELADDARRKILEARTIDELVEVWNGPEILSNAERAKALRCGDERAEETTVYDLFRKASEAIKAGAPLVDAPAAGDHAEQTEDGIVDVCGDCGHPVDDCQCPPAGTTPTPENVVAELETVLAGLDAENPQALSDVIAWAERNGYPVEHGNLETSELDNTAAGAMLDAISSGEALDDNTIRETLNETPVELVIRILGAKVIEERANTRAETERALAEEAEQNRRDAAEATAPRPGSRAQRTQAAAEHAREELRKARGK